MDIIETEPARFIPRSADKLGLWFAHLLRARHGRSPVQGLPPPRHLGADHLVPLLVDAVNEAAEPTLSTPGKAAPSAVGNVLLTTRDSITPARPLTPLPPRRKGTT